MDSQTDAVPYIFLAFAREEIAPFEALPRLHEEARLLRQILENTEHAARWVVVERQNATFDDILEEFQHGRHGGRIVAFHFAGHSEGDTLLMQDRAGQALRVGAAELADFLSTQHNLRFVFLNACYTQTQSVRLISTARRAALTIKDEINDRWAMSFAVIFYRALAGGRSVGEAYAQAVSAVQAEGYSDPQCPSPDQWDCASADSQAMNWSLLQAQPTLPTNTSNFLEEFKRMLAQREFSPEDQAMLLRMFRDAACDLHDARIGSEVLGYGDTKMPGDFTDTIPMEPYRLRKTAQKLAMHMVAVAENKDIWPELLIGDELVGTSIDSLNTIRLEVKNAAQVLDTELPHEYQRRHSKEREGLLTSADSLVDLFEELSSCMDTAPERPRMLAKMKQQLNELSYYTSRYIVWLEMVANLKARNPHNSH